MVAPWSDIRLLTANINGVKRNENFTVSSLVVPCDLVCLQETNYHDVAQRATFLYHVSRQSHHCCFYSDFQSLEESKITHPRAGVMKLISFRLPGSSDVRVISSKTIPVRYPVVTTQVGGSTCFFQNDYTPCENHAKTAFYADLSSHCYPEGAVT